MKMKAVNERAERMSTEMQAASTTALQFDYSGLDVKTVDTLHLAENLIRKARQKYIVDVAKAVSIAHEQLCGTVVALCDNGKTAAQPADPDGRFAEKENTFRAWCASVGVGKDTAYRLLQVDELMSGSTPEEQAVLEQAPTSLLYAAAKPNAPSELVEQVKSGEIVSNAAYQRLLKELEQTKRSLANTEGDLVEMDRKLTLAENRQRQKQKQVEALQNSEATCRAELKRLQQRPIEVTGISTEEKNRLIEMGRRQVGETMAAALEQVKAQLACSKTREAELQQQLEQLLQHNTPMPAGPEQIAVECTAELKRRFDQLKHVDSLTADEMWALCDTAGLVDELHACLDWLNRKE